MYDQSTKIIINGQFTLEFITVNSTKGKGMFILILVGGVHGMVNPSL